MTESRLALRPSLRTVLLYGGVLVTAISVSLFAAAMIVLTHIQVHKQTDSLLLQLAAAAADDLHINRGAPTLRDVAVVLSASQNEVSRRYALVLDEGCVVLAASKGMEGTTTQPFWCQGLATPGSYHHLQEITNPSPQPNQPYELRAVIYAARSFNEKPRYLFIGIDDDLVDDSTWQAARTAPPLALLVIFAISAALALLGRRLNAALARLNDACEQLGERPSLTPVEEATAQFEVPPNAPREVLTLSLTIQKLVRRIGGLLEIQERFLAEAAHELRTPLTALQGELELALRRERSPEDYKKALADAFTDAKRLSALSEALLDAARARTVAVEPKPTALLPLIKESLRRFSRQLETEKIEVLVEADPADPFLAQAHALSVSRVLDNLLRNALLHANPSQLCLSLHRDHQPNGDWLELSITDNGPGIPEQLREHLFTPFQRASQAKGHGLGLYLSQLLLQRQSGELTCPKTDKGATFVLRLHAA